MSILWNNVKIPILKKRSEKEEDVFKKIMIIFLIFFTLYMTSATAYNSYYDEDNSYESSSSYESSDDGLWVLWLFVAFIVSYYIILIVLSIWVYKDAKKRGEQNPVIWLLVVLFGGIVGLIVWFVVRPPVGGSHMNNLHSYNRIRYCPACGRQIPFNATYCPYCNRRF